MLNVDQIPPHNHAVNAVSDEANQESPSGNLLAKPTGDVLAYHDGTGNPNNVAINANTTSKTGAGQQHDNMQPFLGIYYAIALQGIFPSRS